eukprot:gnl/TRDRNA2_/TRDRNA2_177033_c1_seq2.p1 gnl/TRDRNA2_/TRDRNA2_177033_c1~~gnl/TRDRNA2_/TRDRNA2_177033_c1_seq2.p1  ORF type:complete len:309 (+),score=-22.20 gnl/TRDRNA2_/TRDRNA2_177033_c1_seq2:358-1284(+)
MLLKKKSGIQWISNEKILEWMKVIRTHLGNLIPYIVYRNLHRSTLGLSHSLSRHRLRFSRTKSDNMISQAVSLFDDINKNLKIYFRKVKEYYGWHFPEMAKIVTEPLLYTKVVRILGKRHKSKLVDLSDLLPKSSILEIKRSASESMGLDLSQEDITNIELLCHQVIALSEHRDWLQQYISNRITMASPNLVITVGEVVAARFLARIGSLLDLAKLPASTIQVLGAERAFFHALKTNKNPPKYGLIYHASLVKQSPPPFKGKISRSLAAKCSLSIRLDAFGESPKTILGNQGRANVNSLQHFYDKKNY